MLVEATDCSVSIPRNTGIPLGPLNTFCDLPYDLLVCIEFSRYSGLFSSKNRFKRDFSTVVLKYFEKTS